MARLKEVFSGGGLKVGTFVGEFATPGIGYILKNAGLDFVFLDMEHTGFDVMTVKSLLRYFEAADLPCVIRPAGKDYYDMARVLDVGAEGLILPMVSGAEEVRQIVHACKYAPIGGRGVALSIMHDHFTPGAVLEKLDRANRETMIFPLIETVAGVEAVEEIAAIDGVDGLWLGHFDLSCSLGIPGAFDDPRFNAAVERVAAAGKAVGKPVGRMCNDPAEGMKEYARGFELLGMSGDIWMLQTAMTEATAALRKGVAAQR